MNYDYYNKIIHTLIFLVLHVCVNIVYLLKSVAERSTAARVCRGFDSRTEHFFMIYVSGLAVRVGM